MNKQPRILVIIPAYNEEENIAAVINEVRKEAPQVDVLVVNDGSKDKTAMITRELRVPTISLPYTLGIGGAVQTGLKFAKMRNYDIAIQIDGDGQHDPSFISRVVKPVVEEKADISIGSRYLENENVNMSFVRGLGVRFFSWLSARVTGKHISDCTSGFRALNKRAIQLFAEEYPADFPDAEALILAHRTGLEISEVPARFRSRERGTSSLHFWRFLWYPIKEGFSILMLLTKKRRD